MAKVKFPSEMPSANNIGGNDKMMIAKEGTGETYQATFDQAKQYLTIEGQRLASVAPGALPAGPAGQTRYMEVTAVGTWTYGGSPVGTNADGYQTTFWWNGTAWSNNESVRVKGDMPEGTDSLEEEKVPKGKAVIDYATPLTSERILPGDYSYVETDRVDLPEKKLLLITNQEGKVIVDLNKRYYLLEDFDRPDLLGQKIFINSQNRVVKKEVAYGGNIEDNSIQATDLFYNPSQQESYIIGSSGTQWVDSDAYHDLWQPFLNDSTYVTRTLLGVSSIEGKNIFQYEFKPKNPTRKVILFGGTHGSEKIAPVVLYRFFKNLVENYSHSPALQWAKKNLHVIVVPLLSPESYNNRCRRVKETAPFSATWIKSGNIVTISFQEEDFPDTNPNVSASNYFSGNGMVNKTMLSVIESTNVSALPNNGYVIKSVVNGQTITIETPSSGSASGNCEIYVSIDPNRTFDTPFNKWEDFTPSGGFTTYTEPVAVRNDNKGTKPYSINESVIAKEVMDTNQDATFLIDFHNGAGNYDFRWNANITFDRNGADIINDLHRYYTDIFDVKSTNNNVLSAYASQVHNINGTTVEWGEYSTVNIQQATDSQRWFGNLILIGSWYYKNKLQ